MMFFLLLKYNFRCEINRGYYFKLKEKYSTKLYTISFDIRYSLLVSFFRGRIFKNTKSFMSDV